MAKADIVTLPLALEDALPVGLSAAGMFIVASEVASDRPERRPWLLAGAALVATGGAAKVAWKLLVVAGHDVGWLQDLLFVLMAPGMALLAAGVAASLRAPSRRWAGPPAAALMAVAIGATAAASSWGAALVTARVQAIVGATALSVLLMVAAERAAVRSATVLLAVNLLVTMVMARLAAIEDQTTALQWTEQLVNTASQGAFLLAAVRLRARGALRRPDLTPERRMATIA